MTITIHNVEQDTDEWHELRRGILTSSRAGQFVTPKTLQVASNENTRATTYQIAAERINDWVEPEYLSWDMQRGHFDEPDARDLYSKTFAEVTEVGFITRDDWGFTFGFSPDGLVGDDGLIEIKSRIPKHHVKTIDIDEVPSEFVAQCQMGLLVSGRSWLDFVSYCAGMRLYVKRIHPDPQWQEALIAAGRQLEADVARITANYVSTTEGMPMTERREVPSEEIRF